MRQQILISRANRKLFRKQLTEAAVDVKVILSFTFAIWEHT